MRHVVFRRVTPCRKLRGPAFNRPAVHAQRLGGFPLAAVGLDGFQNIRVADCHMAFPGSVVLTIYAALACSRHSLNFVLPPALL